MSWETFTVGYVTFKGSIDKETQREIIDRLADATECEWTTDDDITYKCQDVNWLSHVQGEEIRDVVKEYKQYFDEVAISIWYLDEADETIRFSGNDYEEPMIYHGRL